MAKQRFDDCFLRGEQVSVSGHRNIFEILDGPNARDEYLIVSGVLKFWVAATAMRRASKTPTKKPHPGSLPTTARIYIDLHGLTGDQAERKLIETLDRALREHSEGLEVNHGIGNGILKARVHRYLDSCRLVSRFGIDPRNPGVTIVIL